MITLRPVEDPASQIEYPVDSRAYADLARKRIGQEPSTNRYVHMDYEHPIEKWLASYAFRRVLDWISRSGPRRATHLERIFETYRDPHATISEKILYAPAHKLIDRYRGDTDVATFRTRISEHRAVIRGLVTTARSLARFGLQQPQRFCYPLFAVWNFTNRCNLRCRHCYQSAGNDVPDNELTLDEKLRIVDDMAEHYLAMMAFAGGEPTISPHLLPVAKRCGEHGMHMSLATHGGLLTDDLCKRIADTGLRYVEISLDSVNPDKHDTFRGVPGMWQRSVEGMKTVVRTEGLRLGVAMCVHRDNLHEVEDMIKFAIDIGAGCFAHFNFIPVGRGTTMGAKDDLTPVEREHLLEMLNGYMQSGKIGIISTSPQYGRVCLANAPLDTGKVAATHCGSGSGVKTRVIAKYLGGCGAGRTYVCLQPDGKVTPCVYMPEQIMGDLRHETVAEIIERDPLWARMNDRDDRWGHCVQCAFKHYCGGCRARADAYFADPGGPDPGCLFNTSHWNRVASTANAPEEDIAFATATSSATTE